MTILFSALRCYFISQWNDYVVQILFALLAFQCPRYDLIWIEICFKIDFYNNWIGAKSYNLLHHGFKNFKVFLCSGKRRGVLKFGPFFLAKGFEGIYKWCGLISWELISKPRIISSSKSLYLDVIKSYDIVDDVLLIETDDILWEMMMLIFSDNIVRNRLG